MHQPAPPIDESSIRYDGWRIVGVSFVMATFGWALGFYGQSVYLAELQRLHGWSASLISGATTFFYLMGALLVAFLSEAMLSWTDYATWTEDDWTCSWRSETHAFTEAVKTVGTNKFVEVDGGTKIMIRGVLEIDAKKIKGVPGFLAGKVGSAVESFLVGRIKPNLIEVTDGLRKYLAAKG